MLYKYNILFIFKTIGVKMVTYSESGVDIDLEAVTVSKLADKLKSTLECRDIPHTHQMLNLFKESEGLLVSMSENIMRNNQMEIYSGAYKVVKLAAEGRK